MKISSSIRGRSGPRRMPLDDLRELFKDREIHGALGIVYKPGDQPYHWDLGDNDDVMVHVKLMPHEQPIMARLAGGPCWRIPAVGSEVAVMVPAGQTAGDAMIVGTLSTGTIPSGLDADTFVIREPKVTLYATGGDVTIGGSANVVLGGGSTAVVINSADLQTWISAVNTAFNGLGVTVTAPTAYTSTKVKA